MQTIRMPSKENLTAYNAEIVKLYTEYAREIVNLSSDMMVYKLVIKGMFLHNLTVLYS